VKGLRQTFNRSKAEVSFAAFQSADVRPMEPEHLRELLLGEAVSQPVMPEVLPYRTLQISLGHKTERFRSAT
jgi:hypothetical protein